MILKVQLEDPEFDVNEKDTSGSTMLHKAVSAKAENIVEILLENNADVNCVRRSDGKTPLMIAIQAADTRVVEKLLKAGADYKTRDNENKSAMYYILKDCSGNLVALFLRASWEETFANHFAEVLSELKNVAWSFHSDETRNSDWWLSLPTDGAQDVLPSYRERLMASIIPSIALTVECIGDILLAEALLRDLDEDPEDYSVSTFLIQISIAGAMTSILYQLYTCCVHKWSIRNSCLSTIEGLWAAALMTDLADSFCLLAAGNRIDVGILMAILLPLLLPVIEIGLATTCKRDHLVSHTLFIQCVVSPLIIVVHAFVFQAMSLIATNENHLSNSTNGLSNVTITDRIFSVLNAPWSAAILALGCIYYFFFCVLSLAAWVSYDFANWYKLLKVPKCFSCYKKKESKEGFKYLMVRVCLVLLTAASLSSILLSFVILGVAEEVPGILFLVVLLLRIIFVGVYMLLRMDLRARLSQHFRKVSVSSDDSEFSTV